MDPTPRRSPPAERTGSSSDWAPRRTRDVAGILSWSDQVRWDVVSAGYGETECWLERAELTMSEPRQLADGTVDVAWFVSDGVAVVAGGRDKEVTIAGRDF